MKKQNKTLITLIAIGVVIFVGYEGFGWKKFIEPQIKNLNLTLESSQSQTADATSVSLEAWQVVEEYLEYARTHNLEGIKSLSYKLS